MVSAAPPEDSPGLARGRSTTLLIQVRGGVIDCQADTDTLNDAGGNNGVWAVGAEEGDGVEAVVALNVGVGGGQLKSLSAVEKTSHNVFLKKNI